MDNGAVVHDGLTEGFFVRPPAGRAPSTFRAFLSTDRKADVIPASAGAFLRARWANLDRKQLGASRGLQRYLRARPVRRSRGIPARARHRRRGRRYATSY